MSTDFQGRTFDLAAVQLKLGQTYTPMELFGTDAAGQVYTGILRLVQSWVMRLLTIQGSMPYAEDEGCSFLADAVEGKWLDEESVRESFDLAVADIQEQFEQEQEDLSEDEQLDYVELLDVQIDEERNVRLSVQIVSKAGESREVVLPLTVSPITPDVRING